MESLSTMVCATPQTLKLKFAPRAQALQQSSRRQRVSRSTSTLH